MYSSSYRKITLPRADSTDLNKLPFNDLLMSKIYCTDIIYKYRMLYSVFIEANLFAFLHDAYVDACSNTKWAGHFTFSS